MFPGWTGNPPGVQPQLAGPTTPLSVIDTPADTIVVMEKGQNDGSSSWPFFNAGQENWTGGVGSPAGSYDNPNHYDVDDKGLFGTRHHNCDLAYSTSDPHWDEYGSCSTMPRYRHQNTCNVSFADGHAKAMKAGSVSWAKNIYIPGVWSAQNPAKPVDTGTGAGPG
jgi:prepilin-type processing-associated H-X9-DG protein